MILNDVDIDEYINIVDDKVMEIKKKWEDNTINFNIKTYIPINKLIESLNINIAYTNILNSINKNIINNEKNKKTLNYLNIIELSLLSIEKLKNLNYKKPSIEINGNRSYNNNRYYYNNKFKLETEDNYNFYNANISIKNERNYSQYLFNIPIYGDKVNNDSNFIDLY